MPKIHDQNNGFGGSPGWTKPQAEQTHDHKTENHLTTKPFSTVQLPRPTDPDTGTSTFSDIRTTKSSSKRPTNATYYIGGKA